MSCRRGVGKAAAVAMAVATGMAIGRPSLALRPLDTEEWWLAGPGEYQVEMGYGFSSGGGSRTRHTMVSEAIRPISRRADASFRLECESYPSFRSGPTGVGVKMLAWDETALRWKLPGSVRGMIFVERGLSEMGGRWGYEIAALTGRKWGDFALGFNLGATGRAGDFEGVVRVGVEVPVGPRVVVVQEAKIEGDDAGAQVGARWEAPFGATGDWGLSLWRERGEWRNLLQVGVTLRRGPGARKAPVSGGGR